MRRVPVYLAWYFLRIRKHHGEQGYFDERFENMDSERMLVEVQMLGDLANRRLILLPEETDREKTFNPLEFTDPRIPGFVFRQTGKEDTIPYWNSFSIAPLGHYFLRETAVSLALSAIGTFLVALVGALVANWLSG